jgi:hypothetical protein
MFVSHLSISITESCHCPDHSGVDDEAAAKLAAKRKRMKEKKKEKRAALYEKALAESNPAPKVLLTLSLSLSCVQISPHLLRASQLQEGKQAKALAYLKLWRESRKEWKFKKPLQVFTPHTLLQWEIFASIFFFSLI